MSGKLHICVIGAGVNGLASALQILEAFPSVDLTVMGEKLTPDTTGDGSAGFWEPYLVGDTSADDVRRWSKSTLDFLLRILYSDDAHTAGIELLPVYNLFGFVPEDPPWTTVALGFRHATRREIDFICPSAKHCWAYNSIICTVYRYLPWLQDRIQQKGGRILKRKVNSIEELAGKYDIIVNCSGLGSYYLFNDKTMQPIQGQVLKATNTACRAGIFYFEESLESGATYIIPGKDSVTLGGTAVKGAWDTTPNPETTRDILERCSKLMPSLKQATIVKEWVGLRPWRAGGIRIERESKMVKGHKVHIVHNYGHSGSGVTLHWGCAEDVVKLVRDCILSSFQSRL